METLRWILQALTALLFIAGGLVKLLVPREKMIPKQPYVKDYTAAQIKWIGTAEILGAIGLLVPAATGILPVLTPIAAVGLCVIMLFATRLHLREKEMKKVAIIVVMIFVTGYVAILS
jgi:uncharacterized membrane protein